MTNDQSAQVKASKVYLNGHTSLSKVRLKMRRQDGSRAKRVNHSIQIQYHSHSMMTDGMGRHSSFCSSQTMRTNSHFITSSERKSETVRESGFTPKTWPKKRILIIRIRQQQKNLLIFVLFCLRTREVMNMQHINTLH